MTGGIWDNWKTSITKNREKFKDAALIQRPFLGIFFTDQSMNSCL